MRLARRGGMLNDKSLSVTTEDTTIGAQHPQNQPQPNPNITFNYSRTTSSFFRCSSFCSAISALKSCSSIATPRVNDQTPLSSMLRSP